MHYFQLRETNRPPRQPLDPRPEIEVLALYPLGVALADLVALRGEVAVVSAPIVREVFDDVERFKQGFQFLENLVRASAEHVGKHPTGGLVDGEPEPALIRLAAYV